MYSQFTTNNKDDVSQFTEKIYSITFRFTDLKINSTFTVNCDFTFVATANVIIPANVIPPAYVICNKNSSCTFNTRQLHM